MTKKLPKWGANTYHKRGPAGTLRASLSAFPRKSGIGARAINKRKNSYFWQNMVVFSLEYDVSSQEHMSKVAPAITGK